MKPFLGHGSALDARAIQPRSALAFLSCALYALLTTSTIASAGENELGIRFSSQFVGSSGSGSTSLGAGGLFAVGSSGNLYQGEFTYSHVVYKPRVGALWAELAWTVGTRGEPRLFGAFTSNLLAQDYTVGARYTVPIFSWLVPQIRAGIGALVGQYSLSNLGGPGGSGTSESAWSAAATAYILGGVELLIPRSPRRDHKPPTTAGLVIEAGYSYATPLSFHLQPSVSSDALTIPLTGTDFGAFALSGAVLRVGGVLRF